MLLFAFICLLPVAIYDFNMSGMAKQALLLLVDQKEWNCRPVISEVDGCVVERGTTIK
jgi:hypothetical protein